MSAKMVLSWSNVKPALAIQASSRVSPWNEGYPNVDATLPSMNGVDLGYRNGRMRSNVLHSFNLRRAAWSLDDAMPANSHRDGAERNSRLPSRSRHESGKRVPMDSRIGAESVRLVTSKHNL